ncbi:MAG: FtsW/RodA/SpoVE family cell cycle protein [Victivallales bacterium]|nr:FtsW/RodA/SpoVE family cell cycle protein [Victivallales bacterium]
MKNTGTYLRHALLLAIVLGLCAYSLLFIYSTGYIGDEYPVRLNWQRQAVFFAVGLLGVLPAAYFISRSWFKRWFVYGGYAFSIISLLLVLLFGQKTGGATRWLPIGPFLFPPAEFAKVFTILAAGSLMSDYRKGRFKSILLSLALVLPPLLLIMVEPSYGSAFSLLPPVATMCLMHLPGKRLFQFTIIATLAIIVLWCGSLLWLRSEQGSKQANKILTALSQDTHFLRDYHVRRIKGYLDKNGDWNERQSVLTISSGGSSGKGYLQGTMKGLGYLPRTVAPTDFIFAVICEELGFFYGALPILLLYAIMLALLLWNGAIQDKEANLLCCTGIAMLLFTHIGINLAMTMRLLPIIGLPLPLLSYGGSYTLAVCLGLGAVLPGEESPTLEQSLPSFTIEFGNLLKVSLNR